MGNISENKINVVIPPADITMYNTSIAAIAGKVPNISLTPEQRDGMLSIDVENKVFVEDVINEIGISGVGILPPFITAANVQSDLTLFEQMDVLEAGLLNLLQKVKDVKLTASDEAMSVSNTVYKMYEMAHNAGILSAKQGYEKLRERYRKQATNTPAPTP